MNWRSRALCRGAGWEPFVPDDRPSQPPAIVLALCPICPVRAKCEHVGRATASDGWWGGVFLGPEPIVARLTVELECVMCGQPFTANNAHTALYCSHKCSALASYHRKQGHAPLATREAQLVSCECCWCHGKFNAQRPDARYCSGSCKEKQRRHLNNVGVLVTLSLTVEVAA